MTLACRHGPGHGPCWQKSGQKPGQVKSLIYFFYECMIAPHVVCCKASQHSVTQGTLFQLNFAWQRFMQDPSLQTWLV